MAMDNATTNAKDMVHGLSIVYNRARQAKITTVRFQRPQLPEKTNPRAFQNCEFLTQTLPPTKTLTKTGAGGDHWRRRGAGEPGGGGVRCLGAL
jgi:hypothetical protein